MANAVEAVERGYAPSQVAAEYNVPISTLRDRLCGRVKLGARSGPPKYLSDFEEKELEQFLLRCAKIGYPKSRKQVIAIVQRVLDIKGICCTVTDGWWSSFCKRHPYLCLRIPSQLSVARASIWYFRFSSTEPSDHPKKSVRTARGNYDSPPLGFARSHIYHTGSQSRTEPQTLRRVSGC